MAGALSDGMPITEPTTLLTDYLLAAVALGLGARVADASSRAGSWPQRLWALAFGVGAAAAAAGGTVHGLRAVLGPLTQGLLWQCALLGSALAGALLVAGVAHDMLEGGVRRLALAAVAALLAVQLVWISRAGLTRDAVWAGATAIVLLLALTLLKARTDKAPLGWLLLGLALAGAGLAVQAARVSLRLHFNHNDLCHVLLTAALWPFYRAGLCLGPQTAGEGRSARAQSMARARVAFGPRIRGVRPAGSALRPPPGFAGSSRTS
jgi:hypothetical protein